MKFDCAYSLNNVIALHSCVTDITCAPCCAARDLNARNVFLSLVLLHLICCKLFCKDLDVGHTTISTKVCGFSNATPPYTRLATVTDPLFRSASLFCICCWKLQSVVETVLEMLVAWMFQTCKYLHCPSLHKYLCFCFSFY